MLPTNPSAQLALDLVGVFVFALSGGLVAVKKRFDLFGVLVLAAAAASCATLIAVHLDLNAPTPLRSSSHTTT